MYHLNESELAIRQNLLKSTILVRELLNGDWQHWYHFAKSTIGYSHQDR